MIVSGRVGDGEADRDDVQKRRVGEFGSGAAEVITRIEDELEKDDARFAGAALPSGGKP